MGTLPFLAYIDPGSGILLLQALASGALGAIFLFRNKVLALLGKIFGRTRRSAENPQAR